MIYRKLNRELFFMINFFKFHTCIYVIDLQTKLRYIELQ